MAEEAGRMNAGLLIPFPIILILPVLVLLIAIILINGLECLKRVQQFLLSCGCFFFVALPLVSRITLPLSTLKHSVQCLFKIVYHELVLADRFEERRVRI